MNMGGQFSLPLNCLWLHVGMTGRFICKLPQMSSCFLICEIGILLLTVGMKWLDAWFGTGPICCKHLINVNSCCSCFWGSTWTLPLRLWQPTLVNIPVSWPEDHNFPAEEADWEARGCDGRGGWDGPGKGLCGLHTQLQRARMVSRPRGGGTAHNSPSGCLQCWPGKSWHACPRWPSCQREELGRQKRRKAFSVEAEGTAWVEGKKWEQQCLQKKWEEPVCGEQRAFVLCGRVGSGHRGQGRRPSPVLFQIWEG